MKPGELIQNKDSTNRCYCKILPNTGISRNYLEIQNRSYLLFVGEKALTSKDEGASKLWLPSPDRSRDFGFDTFAPYCAVSPQKNKDKILIFANDEFQETGEIKGYSFLSPEGILIWISHYDMKFVTGT